MAVPSAKMAVGAKGETVRGFIPEERGPLGGVRQVTADASEGLAFSDRVISAFQGMSAGDVGGFRHPCMTTET